MRQNIAFLLIFAMAMVTVNAQLNDYKYIIVPKKFSTFKNENQYQTSTLIKYLFTKKGFDAVYEGDFPEDLVNNPCLGARVDILDESSLFKTKTTMVLKDCKLTEVFKTAQGSSKIKEFKKAYVEAIRDAFTSFDAVDYKYDPKPQEEEQEETITVSFKNDVKSLDEEETKQKMVEQKATQEEQLYKSHEPVASSYTKVKDAVVAKSKKELLYAQPIENGYQLVDSSPKVRYRIFNTSAEGIYLVESEELINGLVIKKSGMWVLEGTKTDGTKVKEELLIKF